MGTSRLFAVLQGTITNQTKPTNQSKQEVMVEQQLKQTSSNIFFPRESINCDMFSNKQQCGNSNQNVMLGGVNLGDIMRQTVMEEMRLIKVENDLNLQRMGGC